MLPEPLFEIFGRGVYMYGILIGIGLVACLAVFFLCTKKKGMPSKVQDFVFGVAIVAIAIGFLFAKLFQAVYNWIESGFTDFDFYGAGITAMGGFIGGALAFVLCYFLAGKFIFKGQEKGLHIKNFNRVLSIAPSCITIAHAFGRLGCLCAGCCYGRETEPGFFLFSIYNAGAYRLPVQLYEALFLFALFGVLTYLYFHRCNFNVAIYLIAYACWRFFIEFLRTDARGAVVLGLQPSQWLSVLFIVGGIAQVVSYKLLRIPLIYPKGDTEMSLARGKKQAQSVAIDSACIESETAKDATLQTKEDLVEKIDKTQKEE